MGDLFASIVLNGQFLVAVPIAMLAGLVSFASPAELLAALDVVAAHRRALLEPLVQALAGMPILAQPKWVLWRSHQEHRDAISELFVDALNRTASFIDPVVGATALDRNWDPTVGLWR